MSKTAHTPGRTKQRRLEIIKQLADLSRNGWANARPCDYEPLERELAALAKAEGR